MYTYIYTYTGHILTTGFGNCMALPLMRLATHEAECVTNTYAHNTHTIYRSHIRNMYTTYTHIYISYKHAYRTHIDKIYMHILTIYIYIYMCIYIYMFRIYRSHLNNRIRQLHGTAADAPRNARGRVFNQPKTTRDPHHGWSYDVVQGHHACSQP